MWYKTTNPATTTTGNTAISTTDKRLYGNRITAIGDSITCGHTYLPAGTGFDVGSGKTDASFFNHLCVLGGFHNVGNAGISGDRSDWIVQRFDTAILPKQPDICFIMAGQNDRPPLVFGDTFLNLKTMVRRCKENNIIPVVLTILPRDATNDETDRFTEQYALLGEQEDILIVSSYDALVGTNGLADSSYFYPANNDHVHTSPKGANKIAREIMKYVARRNEVYTPKSVDSTFALFKNPIFTTTTTASGVPTNWTITGGAVTTSFINTDTSIVGNWVEISRAVDPGAGVQTKVMTPVTAAGAVSNGDTVRFTFKFQAEPVSVDFAYSIQVEATNVGTPNPIYSHMEYWRVAMDGFVSFDVKLPNTSPTDIKLVLRIHAGTGKLRFAQMNIMNLTKQSPFFFPATTTPPNDVVGLTGSAITQSGCTLNWTAPTPSANSFDIIYTKTGETNYQLKNRRVNNISGNVITYTIPDGLYTTLTANTEYTVKVLSRDIYGNIASGGTGASFTFTTLL